MDSRATVPRLASLTCLGSHSHGCLNAPDLELYPPYAAMPATPAAGMYSGADGVMTAAPIPPGYARAALQRLDAPSESPTHRRCHNHSLTLRCAATMCLSRLSLCRISLHDGTESPSCTWQLQLCIAPGAFAPPEHKRRSFQRAFMAFGRSGPYRRVINKGRCSNGPV
jgi:hypothetical protein